MTSRSNGAVAAPWSPPNLDPFGGTDTPAPVAPLSMSDTEIRFGLQPIAELLAERAHLIDQVATLRARYGAFGTFDNLRKVELARLKALSRAQMTAAGAKVTNDQLDDLAHSHPDYIGFITTATVERAQWAKLEAAIEGIDFTIQRGQAVARLLGPGGRNG